VAQLDQTTLLSALFGLIGAIIGSIITYLGVVKDVQSKYNTELHKERIVAYNKVWKYFFLFQTFQDLTKSH
jgi:hypothetical protein